MGKQNPPSRSEGGRGAKRTQGDARGGGGEDERGGRVALSFLRQQKGEARRRGFIHQQPSHPQHPQNPSSLDGRGPSPSRSPRRPTKGTRTSAAMLAGMPAREEQHYREVSPARRGKCPPGQRGRGAKRTHRMLTPIPSILKTLQIRVQTINPTNSAEPSFSYSSAYATAKLYPHISFTIPNQRPKLIPINSLAKRQRQGIRLVRTLTT